MSAETDRFADTQGILYIVATPIGNLGDISSRAVEVLAAADVIAAEDTRHSGRLLHHLGLSKTMVAVHDHNERDRAAGLLDRVARGEQVALISDAGTPLISDPGYVLVREARARGLKVVPVPGPCALVVALSAAGLPTDRFVFEGFLPAKRGARRTALEAVVRQQATLVFYESPRRIRDAMADIAEILGGERRVVLARELTKTFETFYSGSATEVCQQLQDDAHGDKGEYVVMVHGAASDDGAMPELDVERLLRLLLAELPVKKAAKITAELTGMSRNELYQRALQLKGS
ncbi:16S rRNA (cytidine(1402)-2'-O)-methyltransferase [Marinobacter sp. X15-166B]|uniref:16S rRNA (cytidine(1402)-2'-O)-methyltransferase n=1 Tax=Marinobacter sp. X15-166B TaxID=1897620 RepID=UPI00085C036D|nr:16S rRNA (cytidine(1402)-2'-O)-methyltransferase [Marinobacter sp. X15-166B]OEY66688.1 16S rRNA (cytidine(1402)-2'-O)-methyltransferase [Marinobacter sp. X15-166B]